MVEAMRLGKRTPSRRFRAAIVPVDMLVSRAPELPDARIGRSFGVAELDRAERPVDWHTGIAKSQAQPFDDDIGVADVTSFAHEPVAHCEGEAEPLIGKRCGKIGHGLIP